MWHSNDKTLSAGKSDQKISAYYQALIAGEGRAEALRQVQREMLASPARRRPLYWASFIPIGAWGPIAPATASASLD